MQQQWGIKEMLANVMTQTRVLDVFILWLYHLRGYTYEVWMLPGTARVMKSVPSHRVDEQLPKQELSNI